jgi:hypothetical protein
LWWVPSSSMSPRWPADGSAFISHYDYFVGGQVQQIDPSNVIHLRDGFDPRNVRLGLSPLHAMVREIATDNEAANWSASLLHNSSVPGVIISPEGDIQPSVADLEQVKADFMQRFGGDNRGMPLVMKGSTKVTVLSFSPEQMNLRALRQIPEERITAVLGIPAAVVGLGAGLDTTKVGATMREMREQAYESCLIPLQRLISAELQSQLAPSFGDPAKLRVQFDLTEVRVLQDDQNALHTRAREDWLAGLLTLNQSLGLIGEEPLIGPEGDVRIIPNTHTTVRIQDVAAGLAAGAAAAPQPLALPPGTPPGEEPPGIQTPPPGTERAPAGKGVLPSALKAAALSDDDILARYEKSLPPLVADLADELHGAFEAMVETVAGRAMSYLKAGTNGHARVAVEVKADLISGLVTDADHADVRSLLRSAVLKGMRSAADDLSPLTDGTVRITRASPAYKAAVADMESRLPGIVETTGADFSRLVARLERRPGSVDLATVREALTIYVADTYPGRSEAIARTEMGYAHAAGVIAVAEKSGLATRVHVHDGTDDGPCKERNGMVLSLADARGEGLNHPNCALRLIPVIEAGR